MIFNLPVVSVLPSEMIKCLYSFILSLLWPEPGLAGNNGSAKNHVGRAYLPCLIQKTLLRPRSSSKQNHNLLNHAAKLTSTKSDRKVSFQATVFVSFDPIAQCLQNPKSDLCQPSFYNRPFSNCEISTAFLCH